MKIGEFAKKYNTSLSTIRHYMELGILLPVKNGGQYAFTDKDCEEMELILELKGSGFQLRELQKYISIIRLYDSRDDVLYEKLHELLLQKHESMKLEKQQMEHQISLIAQKILQVEGYCKKGQPASALQEENSIHAQPGVPLEFISYMRCPFCQSPINLENVKIQGSSVLSGSFCCTCGYEASIRDGIIFTGDITYVDGDPEFSASYYGGNPLLENFDSMLFECIDKSSMQFLTAMHKAGVWLHETLMAQKQSYPCILFPDISTHFLYNYHASPYLKNSLLLVTALTEKSLLPMKQHLSSLDSNLKIVYLVNQDGKLPLKDGGIDLIVDFLGTVDLSFFSKVPYLDLMHRYLSPNAAIAGSLDYYAPGAKSLRNIQELYKNAQPDNMKLTTIKKSLSKHGFQIERSETTLSNFDPGEYFEYNEPGETRSNFVFFAKRSSSAGTI